MPPQTAPTSLPGPGPPVQYNPTTSFPASRQGLSTITGPQTSVRYGPAPSALPPAVQSPGGLSTVQGPQTTTRYTLSNSQTPGPPQVRPPPVSVSGVPTRTASQGYFQPTTTTIVRSPLSLPSSAGPSSFSTPPAGGIPTSIPSTSQYLTMPHTSAAQQKVGGRKPMTVKGSFSKEIHALMFACGDNINPSADTVDVMEEIVIEYIQQLTATAIRGQTKSRLTVEGLRRALGRPEDGAKLGRLNDLVYRNKVIAKARASFKDPS